MKNIVNVAVVVPCYNCEDTIIRAFNSILNQAVLPRQIIMVNDCSTDGTANLIDQLEVLEGIHLRVIHLDKNAGPANARNIGIEESNCEFIAFLDADDTWHPMKIKIQHDVMVGNPDCALSGHKVVFKQHDENIDLMTLPPLCDITFNKLIFKNYFNTPSVMIRRTDLRFPADLRYAEDFYFWLLISSRRGRLIFIDGILGYVHKPFYGHSGLSASLSLMHQFELIVLKRFLKSDASFVLVCLAMAFARFKYILRLLKAFARSI